MSPEVLWNLAFISIIFHAVFLKCLASAKTWGTFRIWLSQIIKWLATAHSCTSLIQFAELLVLIAPCLRKHSLWAILVDTLRECSFSFWHFNREWFLSVRELFPVGLFSIATERLVRFLWSFQLIEGTFHLADTGLTFITVRVERTETNRRCIIVIFLIWCS